MVSECGDGTEDREWLPPGYRLDTCDGAAWVLEEIRRYGDSLLRRLGRYQGGCGTSWPIRPPSGTTYTPRAVGQKFPSQAIGVLADETARLVGLPLPSTQKLID